MCEYYGQVLYRAGLDAVGRHKKAGDECASRECRHAACGRDCCRQALENTGKCVEVS